MAEWIRELEDLESMSSLTVAQLKRWGELARMVAAKQQQEGYVFA